MFGKTNAVSDGVLCVGNFGRTLPKGFGLVYLKTMPQLSVLAAWMYELRLQYTHPAALGDATFAELFTISIVFSVAGLAFHSVKV